MHMELVLALSQNCDHLFIFVLPYAWHLKFLSWHKPNLEHKMKNCKTKLEHRMHYLFNESTIPSNLGFMNRCFMESNLGAT